MRPKRICLCVGTDAAALGVLVFMLRTKGYAVLEAATAEAALSVAGQNDFDLLICFNGIDGQTGDGLICKVKELYPEKPAILIRQTAEASDTCSANAQVVQPWNAMELLERVKVMTARKRGPRPGPAAPAAALRTYAR